MQLTSENQPVIYRQYSTSGMVKEFPRLFLFNSMKNEFLLFSNLR